MKDINDSALVKLAINGDEQAFAELIERHYMMMYKVAYKWCGVKEDAEDIAHNVCIKLHKHLYSFSTNSSFSTWLYRIVINASKDYYRSKKRERNKKEAFTFEHAENPNSPSPERIALGKDIMKTINDLPDKLKDALLLVYSEGMTHKEVAEILDISEGTVSWRIHEAKKELEHLLNEEIS